MADQDKISASIARRGVRRATWAVRGLRGELLAVPTTLRIRRLRDSLAPAPEAPEPLRDLVRLVVSTRIASDERLRILRVVTQRLADGLREDPPAVSVRDASEGRLAAASRATWTSLPLPVEHRRAMEPQMSGFVAHANQGPQPYLAIQFDDTLTVGLTPRYLRAGVRVLERWKGVVDIVCPLWSLDAREDPHERAIVVTSHQERGAWCKFTASRPRRAVAIDVVDGLRFGIFTNPSYGFFFNHMLVPREDYGRRLDWYDANVPGRSVHAVEVTARDQGFGPAWRHVAVCLDHVALLDLDYAHTDAAIRPQRPELRSIVDRLDQGWRLRVTAQGRR